MTSIKNFLQGKFLKLKSDKNKLWKIITIFSIALFLLLAFFVFWHFLRPQPKPTINKTAIQKEKEITITASSTANCPGCVRRALDGVWVLPNQANLPPLATMIDNHPSARPARGLEKASVVYEAEVEGNYTRYMAVFASTEDIKQIGPIRSARGYFLDWAGELNAVYVHCGGSPEALVKITKKGINDLNEFYNGQYFWRATDGEAPHNVITSSANLNKLLENKKISSGNYSPWLFKDDKPLTEAKNQKISIAYNHPDFKVSWQYNAESNDYLRYLVDKPQVTYDNNTINAKNIIIQVIPAEVVDAKLRLDMEATGTGKATICQDGECKEGEWAKEDFHSRTKFQYLNGKEVEFNAGQTWVEVIRPSVEVVY